MTVNTVVIIPITDIKGQSNKDDLEGLLSSISPDTFKQIVCAFDACNPDFVAYFQNKFPFIMAHENIGNRDQFTKNVNRAMRFVYNNFNSNVLLLNQDCIVDRYLCYLGGTGIVSAQSVDDTQRFRMLNDVLEVRDTEIGSVCHPLSKKIEDKVPFYCTFINRAVIEKIGFLDGVFPKVFSDDDYCVRALLAGFPVEIADVFLYHRGTHIDSSQPDWESASGCYNGRDLGMSMAQYLRKWSTPNYPKNEKGQIEHGQVIPTILKDYTWDDAMRIS